MEKAKLTQNQLRVIRCILETNSLEGASRRAKVSRSSIYNWLKDETFRKRLRKERDTLFYESLDLLKQATREAVNVLINLLKSKNETTRRLVAREILNQSLRITEIRDLEERISEIEQIVKQQYQNL